MNKASEEEKKKNKLKYKIKLWAVNSVTDIRLINRNKMCMYIIYVQVEDLHSR